MSRASFRSTFSTVELFEVMLLQLPFNELLQAQRVSRHWQHIITTSPTLQQKLFFQPLPPSSSPHFNPLFQSIFAPVFNIYPRALWGEHGDTDGREVFDWLDRDLDWLSTPHRHRFLRPDASWRKMLPVQPPSTIVYAEEKVPCCTYQVWENYAHFSSDFEALQSQGLRMGLLYDVIAHMTDGVEGAEFMIDWKMFRPIPKGCRGNLTEEEVKGTSDEKPVNEVHVYFTNSMCHGRPEWATPRTQLTIVAFDEELLGWKDELA